MFLLLLLLTLIVSVTVFFKLAIKFGNPKTAPTDMLDLDTIPRPVKAQEVLIQENPEDLIV